MRRIVHIGIAILLSSSAAMAAQREPSQLEATLNICAGLRNNTERLACFDRTVMQLHADSADAKPADIAPEAMFGVSKQARGAAPADVPDRQELASIRSSVTGLRQAADGSLLVELENGQTWRQVDSRPLALKVGDTVTISRAAFDSFRIASPDNRFGRVQRVQ